MMYRLLFLTVFLLTCFIQLEDAMFTNGRSLQEVMIFIRLVQYSNIVFLGP